MDVSSLFVFISIHPFSGGNDFWPIPAMGDMNWGINSVHRSYFDGELGQVGSLRIPAVTKHGLSKHRHFVQSQNIRQSSNRLKIYKNVNYLIILSVNASHIITILVKWSTFFYPKLAWLTIPISFQLQALVAKVASLGTMLPGPSSPWRPARSSAICKARGDGRDVVKEVVLGTR